MPGVAVVAAAVHQETTRVVSHAKCQDSAEHPKGADQVLIDSAQVQSANAACLEEVIGCRSSWTSKHLEQAAVLSELFSLECVLEACKGARCVQPDVMRYSIASEKSSAAILLLPCCSHVAASSLYTQLYLTTLKDQGKKRIVASARICRTQNRN
eukprot:332887-Pelagomonas_calceolata.AAC.4